MGVTVLQEGKVAIVTLHDPLTNLTGKAFCQGMAIALDRLSTLTGLSHVVLTGLEQPVVSSPAPEPEPRGGAGTRLAVKPGAGTCCDPLPAPELSEVLARITGRKLVWIAAIRGVMSDRAFDLALACHHRIATRDARIGFSNVSRDAEYRRLVNPVSLPNDGVREALNVIVGGGTVSGEAAVLVGLIDEIAEDPVRAAKSFDPDSLLPEHDAGGVPATTAERGQLSWHQGNEASALFHIVRAGRRSALAAADDAHSVSLEAVAVLGGDAFAADLALELSSAGSRVVLMDTENTGFEPVSAHIDRRMAQARLTSIQIIDLRKRLTMTRDLSVTHEVELAIEAGATSRASLSSHLVSLGPDAVLMTANRPRDILRAAPDTFDPARVLGLRFAPAFDQGGVLELVPGTKTGPTALATGRAVAKRIGRMPVLSGQPDTAIGERLLARYLQAADTVFMDHSTPWDIDEAMEAFGFSIGPFEMQDLVGIDRLSQLRTQLAETRNPAWRQIPISGRMMELGKLGRKTGAGFYRYPGGGGKVDDPIVADLAIEEAHFAGTSRSEIGEEEIRNRLLLAMINEATALLDDGIAISAADVDLVSVFGLGYPPERGGLVYDADRLGPKVIVERLWKLCAEDPVFWSPSRTLVRCARSGTRLADAYP